MTGRLPRRWTVPLLLSLALTAWTRAAEAQVHHVAVTGSDNDPGTETQPFRTINRALAIVAPGATIRVHAGTYPETVWIERSGTPSRPIVLEAAGDGPAVIAPRLPREPCTESEPAAFRAIRIEDGHDWWTIRGLTIAGGVFVDALDDGVNLRNLVRQRSLPGRGQSDPAAARRTLDAIGVDGSVGVRILDNEITSRGIHVVAGREGLIEGNEIHDVACGTGPGIWLNTFTDEWVVRDNHIHDIADSERHFMSEGIRLGGASMYNVIENNVVEDLQGLGRGIATDVNAGWNTIRGNEVRRMYIGLSEQAGGWGNRWIGNLAESIREYGMNLYGVGDGEVSPNDRVPAFLEVACNVVRSSRVGLNAAAVQKSEFRTNDFGTVEVSVNLARYWVSAGNTWDGAAALPPARPPAPDLDGCDSQGGGGGGGGDRIWGDVDLDGDVDAADSNLVLTHAAGLPVEGADFALADVNADGQVTPSDALLILRHADGSPTPGDRTGTPAP
jgi:hypothetical protein